MMILNEKTRTVKMTRREMNGIRVAITSVMCSFEEGTEGREMWEQTKEKFVAQLDEQDVKDKDFHI